MQAGIYIHHKGGYYQVLGLAANSTNGSKEELMVVYVSLTGIHMPGPRMRVRSLQEFVEDVEWAPGLRDCRFKYVGDELAPSILATLQPK